MGRSTRRRQRQPEAQDRTAVAAQSSAEPIAEEVRQTSVPVLEVQSQALKADEALVVRAVETLYDDELRPFGRILRKRVAELAAAAAADSQEAEASASDELPDVDARHLREVCDHSCDIVVEAEDGGDWSALLVRRASNFVDIYSPIDDYPEGLWAAAMTYFDSLTGEEAELPGGRYACARTLLGRGLDFLAGRKLGQVCHIVQLAISQKKVLGYFNGAVVPYSLSLSMLKERCAKGQQQCANAAGGPSGSAPTGPLQPASWEVALRFTKEIINSAPVPAEGGIPHVPLSNVKRLFRSRYCLDLSETALGYSKLSELLQDHRFQDICQVRLQGQGYVVVPAVPPQGQATGSSVECDPGASFPPMSCRSSPSRGSAGGHLEYSPPRSTPLRGSSVCSGSPTISLADSLLGLNSETCFQHSASRQHGGARISLAQSIPLDGDARRDEGSTTICLVNSVLSTPPGLPAGGSGTAISLASSLLPTADDDAAFGQPRRLLFPEGDVLTLEDASPRSIAGSWFAESTPMRSPGVPGSATARRWAGEPRTLQFFPDMAPLELGTPLAAQTPLPSPGVPGDATRRRWAGGPLAAEPLPLLEPAIVSSPLASPLASPGVRGSTSLRGSPDQPCHIHFFPDGLPPPESSDQPLEHEQDVPLKPRMWAPVHTPSSLVRGGRLTKNTFIHAASPALSPPTGLAARRSSSVPRNMGSATLEGTPAPPAPPASSPRRSPSHTSAESTAGGQRSNASSSGAATSGAQTRNPSPSSSSLVARSPRAGPDAAPLKVHFAAPESACDSSDEAFHRTPRSRPLLLPVAARMVGDHKKPLLPLLPRSVGEPSFSIGQAVFESPLDWAARDWTVRNSFVDWKVPKSSGSASHRSHSVPKDFESALSKESPAGEETDASPMAGAFGTLSQPLGSSFKALAATTSVDDARPPAAASWPATTTAGCLAGLGLPDSLAAAPPILALQLSDLV